MVVKSLINSGLISLDELHFEMLERVLKVGQGANFVSKNWRQPARCGRAAGAGLVHLFEPAGGSIPSVSCGWVFSLVWGGRQFCFGCEDAA